MAFTILFSIVDAKGQRSTTEINVPDATPFADVVAFAETMAARIDPLITGAITRIGITRDVPLPTGLRTIAAVGSDIEEGARFQYRTQHGFFTSLRLPTFSESKIALNSTAVNTTDTEVAAFNTAMIVGVDLDGALGMVAPCDKRGEDIVALTAAVEQFVNSRG